MSFAFSLVFRLVGYLALAFVLAAAAALAIILNSGVCPTFSEGGVACVSPLWQKIGEMTMGAMLITAFTGLPLLLAIVGAVFLIVDFRSARRRRRRLRAGAWE